MQKNNCKNLMRLFVRHFGQLVLLVCLSVLGYNTNVLADPPYSNGNGDGSILSPWEIETLQDWNDFANDINTGYYPNGAAVVYFKLTADIGSAQYPCTTMVGDVSNPFKGNFDGNFHTVNLEIIAINSNSNIIFTGLFGRTSNAVIENLTVRGKITSTCTGTVCIGGIVGKLNYTNFSEKILIQNCYNKIKL